MLNFLSQNLATILVLLVVIAVVSLVVIKMIRDKKKGKKSCSYGCGGCPMKDSCHSDKK
ncbi:MAG: FeoB-associated Cys-rich membrane protein [Ruminococcaceae bacterium]|nr:FeoB-associated Cys-rich membrane protein [Oscillospiraceae bacterium]